MLDVSNDELNDHMVSLIRYAFSHGYDIPTTYTELKKHADRADVKLFESCKKDEDALWYVD